MSAFTHNFNLGFFHGMFNGMFGGFGAFNWGCLNFRPSFFTPSYNNSVFYNYQSPMPIQPSAYSYSVPDYSVSNSSMNWQNYNYTTPTNISMNWQSYDYSTPRFQTSSNDVGDTFVRSKSSEKLATGSNTFLKFR